MNVFTITFDQFNAHLPNTNINFVKTKQNQKRLKNTFNSAPKLFAFLFVLTKLQCQKPNTLNAEEYVLVLNACCWTAMFVEV